MLFTESDLMLDRLGKVSDFNSVLKEAVFLEEDECRLNPLAVPVVENTRIGALVANFSDIERLSEENNIDYFDAISAIAEANDVDFDSIAVAVDEARIIADPEIVDEVSNVVVNPISENSDAYVFVDLMVESYAMTGDVDFLNFMLEETQQDTAEVADAAANGDEEKASRIDSMLSKIKQNCINRPKEWIANKIAALNAKLVEYRQKQEALQSDNDSESVQKKSIIRKTIDKLAKCIEFLTAKLTNEKRREEALAARKSAADAVEEKNAAKDAVESK